MSLTDQEAKKICHEVNLSKAENGEEEICEALDIAEKALDKQTPKKPYPPIVTVAKGSCARCNAPLFAKHKYCHNCGQAVDWDKVALSLAARHRNKLEAER